MMHIDQVGDHTAATHLRDIITRQVLFEPIDSPARRDGAAPRNPYRAALRLEYWRLRQGRDASRWRRLAWLHRALGDEYGARHWDWMIATDGGRREIER